MQQSLPLRKALHHDPTLAAPLTALVKLYRDANQADALVALYRKHLDQWPQDAGARIVLLRVLRAMGDPEAGPAAKATAERLPEVPFVQYLLAEQLDADGDPAALDALDRAIGLETSTSRKRQWIDELLPKAATQRRDDLLDKYLDVLAGMVGDSPQAVAEVASVMMRHARHAAALTLLDDGLDRQPAPEVMVEMELLAADAEVGLNRAGDAGRRLEALLGKVAHDYWRRDEILRRRIALVTDAKERHSMIDQARQRLAARQDSPVAVLDLARLLEGFEMRRDALDVLLDASPRLPESPHIENATLALFDVLRDDRGRAEYLAKRLELQPNRDDLADRYARTLYVLGRRDEAKRLLTPRLAAMAEGPRLNRLLEMARFVRRTALPRDAVDLFTQAVAMAPDRLDVRRELAEVYLALDSQREAAALFAEPLPPDATIENLLDLVGLLIDKGMYPEARRALRARIPVEPVNLELRLLLLKVEGELGDVRSGRELSAAARPLADTAARYRSWLEATLQFHDVFDSADVFLEEEFQTLQGETATLTPEDVERRMVFVDVVDAGPMAAAVHAMLRQMLSEPPEGTQPPWRPSVRRRLIALLTAASAPEERGELKSQLEALADEEPAARPEVQARLVVLMATEGRSQDIASLLPSIDLSAIDDPQLLEKLVAVLTQYGHVARLGDVYERIARVDPANRAAWEHWLSALAMRRDEDRLRLAIRRLMVGIDRMPLSEETQATLARGLEESYWRSIARLLAMEGEAPAADALALLDAAGRISGSDAQAMWVTWCRGRVLERLGRSDERDQALAELDRLARAGRPVDAKAPARVSFPSGLGMSIDTARRMLTGPLPSHQNSPADASGAPRGPVPDDGRLDVLWRFDSPGQVPVLAVLDPGDGRLLLVDATGTIWGVSAATGKVLWQRERAIPSVALGQASVAGTDQYGRPYHVNGLNRVTPPLLDADRLYHGSGGAVVCLAADDGRVLWQTLMLTGGPSAGAGISPLSLTVHGRHLWAYDPTDHKLLVIDRDTGKLTDEWALTASPSRSPGAGAPMAACCGAWRHGPTWLVYGTSASIVDLDRREEVWSFASAESGQFPLRLEAPADRGSPAVTMRPGSGGSSGAPSPSGFVVGQSAAPFGRPGHPASGPAPVRIVNMTQPNLNASMPSRQTPVALTLPANAWANLSSVGGQPRLGIMTGERLLLASGQGSVLLPLDLPLSGTSVAIGGTFIGLEGSRACFLDAQGLSTVMLETGQVERIPLGGPQHGQGVRGGVGGTRRAAVLDGPLAYVTEPGGVTGINVVTGRRVFEASWPKDVVDAPVAPGQGGQATGRGGQATNVNYMLGGISLMVPGQGHWGAMMPPVDCITAGGTLITSPVPGRILAVGVLRQAP